jgi:hypothetical protein
MSREKGFIYSNLFWFFPVGLSPLNGKKNLEFFEGVKKESY